MRVWIIVAGLALAAPAGAEPKDAVTTMTLPALGGYLQPGNPSRGVTMAGRENGLVRQRQDKAARYHRQPVRSRHAPLDKRAPKHISR